MGEFIDVVIFDVAPVLYFLEKKFAFDILIFDFGDESRACVRIGLERIGEHVQHLHFFSILLS